MAKMSEFILRPVEEKDKVIWKKAGDLVRCKDFYNYILDSYDVFAKNDGTTLKAAWEMYKNYCTDANVGYPMSMRIFKAELKNYFKEFSERSYTEDGTRVRNLYSGFLKRKFITQVEEAQEIEPVFKFKEQPSVFDKEYADCPAQLASDKETPQFKWDKVKTTLKDIDTHALHYIRDEDYCYECKGYGNDYYINNDGELVCSCPECPYFEIGEEHEET